MPSAGLALRLFAFLAAVGTWGCGNGSSTEVKVENGHLFVEVDYECDGNRVDFSWQLKEPVDQVSFYKGAQEICRLDGGETRFTYYESSFGYFRFTMMLLRNGVPVDRKELLLDFGHVVWQPTPEPISGHYFYVAEAVGDPEDVLPYDDPSQYQCDVGLGNRVSLKILYDHDLVIEGKEYFVAVSSYKTLVPENYISSLSEAALFSYQVDTSKP